MTMHRVEDPTAPILSACGLALFFGFFFILALKSGRINTAPRYEKYAYREHQPIRYWLFTGLIGLLSLLSTLAFVLFVVSLCFPPRS